jgi:hypothetical protein
MYRGFALNQPSKGDGTQLLHNKPSKINNFDPTKVPPIPPPPTDIIRAPPPKKKTPKVSGERSIDGTLAASTSQQHSPATMSRNKKKLDNDVAAKSTEKVKQFLKVAQQQAAMQMQKNGGVSSGTAGISNTNNNHNNTVSTQGKNFLYLELNILYRNARYEWRNGNSKSNEWHESQPNYAATATSTNAFDESTGPHSRTTTTATTTATTTTIHDLSTARTAATFPDACSYTTTICITN